MPATRAIMCDVLESNPGTQGDVIWPSEAIQIFSGEIILSSTNGITVSTQAVTAAAFVATDGGISIGADGDASAPAISRSDDIDTGIYWGAANVMAVACNGANVATFTTTGLQLTTVLAGAYGGTGVANTGKTITVSGNTTIGSSTHTVAFATGGNTSVTLPASGTLATLAGTESLSGKTISLVGGSVGAPALNFGSESSDSDTGVYRVAANQVGISAGGTNIATFGAITTITTGSGADTVSLEFSPTAGVMRLIADSLSFQAPPTEGGNGIIFKSNAGANQAQLYNITGSSTYLDFDTALNVRNGYSGSAVLTVNGSRIAADIPVKLKGYTVGTLPAGTVGDTAYVTDATAPTYNGALTGGGAVTVPVFYNGSAWVSA